MPAESRRQRGLAAPLRIAVICVLLAGWPGSGQSPSPGWRAAYFFDRDDSEVSLVDFAMPSVQCGIAIGELSERGDERPVALVSRDGGSAWTVEKLPKPARSLYFPESPGGHGWLVAEDGIYETADCGKAWQRISKLKNVLRVRFLDKRRGFAMGAPKKVWTTSDGGREWDELPAAGEPRADPERSMYTWADFHSSGWGMITGFHRPRRRDASDAPPWMDPEAAENRRQWPSMTLLLQTSDGGKSWVSSVQSLMGTLTRVRFSAEGSALLLVEFEHAFEWPSEVLLIGADRKKTERVFRSKNHVTTDVMFGPDGTAYVAGFEPPGSMRQIPIPGKVAIGRSKDLTHWEWTSIDYRAVARRVMLAKRDDGSLWAATDTGMILRLEP